MDDAGRKKLIESFEYIKKCMFELDAEDIDTKGLLSWWTEELRSRMELTDMWFKRMLDLRLNKRKSLKDG